MEAQRTRRSDRIVLELPIQVSGADTTGERFAEDTRTVLVSRHGAKIISEHELATGQTLDIRCRSSGKQADARVVGQIGGEMRDGYYSFYYGVEFLNPDVNLWDIEFPPLAESEKAVLRVLLECTHCHTRELTYLDEFRAEIFVANKAVSQPCKHCGGITSWSEPLSEETREALLLAASLGTAQPPRASPPHTLNERKDHRLSLKMNALIRHRQSGEELVATENVSRRGFSFRSSKDYAQDSLVEVAVPYTQGAGNIFVPARIEHAEHLPAMGVTIYGVSYIPVHKGWPGN
jgi:hypothetical protein